MTENERRRAENRLRMPQVTAWVDEMRAAFGDDVRVTYAREGGFVVGKPMAPIPQAESEAEYNKKWREERAAKSRVGV
jgi:hypothetical protein